MTPDYHGILGPVEEAPGFRVACGFSGHRFMDSPAIGIFMIEIVLDGHATSMDIDALSLAQFRVGRVHAEANMF
jgi:sarcosine oxidase subunit beta